MEDKTSISFAERYKAILDVFGLLPADLAKRMEEPVAKFYKYQNGTEPRPAFILRMVQALPGLSEEYALHGTGPVKMGSMPAVLASSLPLTNSEREELTKLRSEKVSDGRLIEELRRQLTEAKQESKEKDREWREWSKDFCESDSHNHRFEKLVRESCRVEGLVRYDVKADGKVIALNAEPKHFVLDSLRYQQPVRQTA